jgi:hypothetical protein
LPRLWCFGLGFEVKGFHSARHIHRLTEPETIPRLAQPCYKRVCEDLS